MTRTNQQKTYKVVEYSRKFIFFLHILLFFGCRTKDKEIRNTFLTGFRENGVYAAFFNPISQDILVGTGEGRILMYDANLKLIDTARVSKGVVATTLCSPDGKYMASTSIDGCLYIWNLEKGNLKLDFKKQSHHLQSMTCLFSPNGKYVASTGADSTVVILSWPQKKIIKTCKSEDGFIRFAWFSEDNLNIIWVNDGGYLFVEKIADNKNILSKRISKYAFSCVVSSQKLQQYTMACDDGNIYIVDKTTLKVSQKIKAHNGPVFVALWNPSFSELSSIGADGYIRKWVIEEGKYELRQEIKAHNGVICTLFYNFDGTKLLSGGQDGWVKIWKSNDMTLLNSVNTIIK